MDQANPPWRSFLLPIVIGLWVCLLLFIGPSLDISLAGKVVLVGLWLVGLLLLSRRYLLSLYGPVMAYDFLRVGRKPRIIWFRLIYAGGMAVVFAWIYLTGVYISSQYSGTTMQTKELARIAQTFFETFMVIQFILVCILTPAAVGGAIADEKERRTLEFLLATDLRDREILFGKLASRVGSLLLFLAAGLPILGMIQFFGGIDPNMVLAGFTATLFTILTLAALGMAASVMSRRTRDAIILTYLLSLSYIVVSLVIFGLAHSPLIRSSFDLLGYTITTVDAAYPLVAGNPFYQVVDLQESRRFQTNLLVYEKTRDYVLFHTLVIALLVGWSALRLRSIALSQLFGSKRAIRRKLAADAKENAPRSQAPAVKVHGTTTIFTRPACGESPILWKEVFVDSGLRLGLFAKIIVWGLIGLSFFPVGIILWDSWIETYSYSYNNSWSHRWDRMADEMNAYVRAVGTMVGTIVFLAIAVRGAGTISGERDKHTLEVLLTTPLSASKILWGKWWGCLLGMRWAWAWLFLVWLVGLALGGIHPIMVIPLLGSTVVYAAGFAWLGVYCSLQFSTSLKASIAAIVASVMLAGGYFLLFVFCCMLPLSFGGSGPGREFDVVIDGLCSISPPVNLAWLPMHEFDERELRLTSRELPYIPFWAFGIIVWVGFSAVMSRVCLEKLQKMANRLPKDRPTAR